MSFPAEDELLPVRVMALLMEPAMNSPVVILHEPEENKVLPIWVGETEARAIATGLGEVEVERPLTHMLAANIMESLGGDLVHVVIEDIEAGTYFASLHIDHGRKRPLVIDARPSDAIALALEFGAEIFVSKSVMDAAGQDNPFPPETTVDVTVAAVNFEMKVADTPESVVKKEESPKKEARKFRTPSKAKTDFSADEILELKSMLDQAREIEADEKEGNQ